MSLLCNMSGHKWGPWKFTFEPGDGSYHWERSCQKCQTGQVSFKEPKELKGA